MSFASFGLSEAMLAALGRKGFAEPTPIQAIALPRLLGDEGHLIVKARTGTGKTAAFGIPLVEKFNLGVWAAGHAPKALILTPTRELALQVSREIDSFRSGPAPRISAVYGGASVRTQILSLKRGAEIVAGTPGRVMDFLERKALDLSAVEWFVLDEADEMLDMGFFEDVETIMKALKQGVKIALFSATMPPQILKVIKEHVGEFRVIEDGAGEDEKPCVDQFYMVLRKEDRLEALKRVIDSAEDFYGLIFCATKAGVDELARRLTENGYSAEAIHGDLSQETREQTLRRFRARRGTAGGAGAGPSILVATDVAARGLDIEKLTHVINWDLPNDRESYIHRIGRTGRAGRRGRAVSLVLPAQRGRMTQLSRFVEHALGSPVQWVKVPTVKSVMKTLRRRIAAGILDAFPEEESAVPAADDDGDGERAGEQEAAAGKAPVPAPLEEEAFSPYIAKLARQLIEARGPERAVEALIASVYGGLLDPARYGEVKEFTGEDFAPRRKGAPARGRPERGAVTSPRRGVKPGVRRGPRRRGFADTAAGDSGETRVYVGLGRKHGANAGDVARLLTRAGGVSGRLVDAIEMKDYCAFATMPRAAARRAGAFSKNTPEDPVIRPAAWKE